MLHNVNASMHRYRPNKERDVVERECERETEKVEVTTEFSLEFCNYFMPLDLQSIINYLFGLACAKSLGEQRDRKKKQKSRREEREGKD